MLFLAFLAWLFTILPFVIVDTVIDPCFQVVLVVVVGSEHQEFLYPKWILTKYISWAIRDDQIHFLYMAYIAMLFKNVC